MPVALTGGPGFYPQPNEWTCGPFALKHALLALGRMVDVTQIASTARTHWWSGTNEIQLARAARDGALWRLSGVKTFISNAGIAGMYTVLARTGEDGESVLQAHDNDEVAVNGDLA